MPEEDEHRCSECGFLALQDARTYVTTSAHYSYRTEGAIGRSEVAARNDTRRLPICALGKRDFVDSYLTWPVHSDPESAKPQEIKQLIDEIYVCDAFYPWVAALPTPKDHWDAKMMEQREKFEDEMRKDARDFEAALQRQQLEFQAAQELRQTQREDARDRAAETHHDEQMRQLNEQAKDARQRHRDGLLVFGGLIAVATIVGSMIQAGWIAQPSCWNVLWCQ
ncbi:MAG: hypothetical protein WC211_02985 [Dehalococcoidia bacterium]